MKRINIRYTYQIIYFENLILFCIAENLSNLNFYLDDSRDQVLKFTIYHIKHYIFSLPALKKNLKYNLLQYFFVYIIFLIITYKIYL